MYYASVLLYICSRTCSKLTPQNCAMAEFKVWIAFAAILYCGMVQATKEGKGVSVIIL